MISGLPFQGPKPYQLYTTVRWLRIAACLSLSALVGDCSHATGAFRGVTWGTAVPIILLRQGLAYSAAQVSKYTPATECNRTISCHSCPSHMITRRRQRNSASKEKRFYTISKNEEKRRAELQQYYTDRESGVVKSTRYFDILLV